MNCFLEKFEKLEDDANYSTTDVNFPSGETSRDFHVHFSININIFSYFHEFLLTPCSSSGEFFLLGVELLAERCRTDDLLPSIPISWLPVCCMDPKVLRLNIIISCFQPGGLWTPNVKGLLQSVDAGS